MGRKGESTGLKRKPAPRFWPIHRKELVWVVKPSPGPHSVENCLPLAVVLRDVLRFAGTRKEAKGIVSRGMVQVDWKTRRKDDFPVGLMDVISMADADKSFRVLPSRKGLLLHPISKDEASFKLCRIENKSVEREGHVKLTFHDGSNILVKIADPKSPQEDVYKTFDTLKLSLPDRQVLERIQLKKNATALITGGKNVGKVGKVVEIEEVEGKKRRESLVVIEDEKGGHYQTVMNFVFVIGEAQPLVSLPEVAQVV